MPDSHPSVFVNCRPPSLKWNWHIFQISTLKSFLSDCQGSCICCWIALWTSHKPTLGSKGRVMHQSCRTSHWSMLARIANFIVDNFLCLMGMARVSASGLVKVLGKGDLQPSWCTGTSAKSFKRVILLNSCTLMKLFLLASCTLMYIVGHVSQIFANTKDDDDAQQIVFLVILWRDIDLYMKYLPVPKAAWLKPWFSIFGCINQPWVFLWWSPAHILYRQHSPLPGRVLSRPLGRQECRVNHVTVAMHSTYLVSDTIVQVNETSKQQKRCFCR